ncbi:MAG TPA: pentapeptide repeat-containing protein, partial [Methanothrix sp.]|nr:pentapeptide repeat-containing protein [Methanothrix sp.]
MVALLLMGTSDASDVVQASAVRDKVFQGEPVDYDYVIIEGDLDLSGMTLGPVDFSNAIFRGDVNFRSVIVMNLTIRTYISVQKVLN